MKLTAKLEWCVIVAVLIFMGWVGFKQFNSSPVKAEPPKKAMLNAMDEPPPMGAKTMKPQAMRAITLPPPPPLIVTPQTPTVKVKAMVKKAVEAKPPQIKPIGIKPLNYNYKKIETSRVKPIASKPIPSLNELAELPSEAPAEQAISETIPPKKAQEFIAKGRPILRQMEFGKGPAIHLIWPTSPAAINRLHKALSACYGMKSLSLQGEVFQDTQGAFTPNQDYYSGFMRQASGQLPVAERQLSHGYQGQIVRIFPRNLDGLLLGQLANLVGEDFMQASIEGTYHLTQDNRLIIEALKIDGNPMNATIDLGAARQCV